MPAPTGLRQPDEIAKAEVLPVPAQEDEILIDAVNPLDQDGLDAVGTADAAQDSDMRIDEFSRPVFTPAKHTSSSAYRVETRKVPVPPHRMTPLKAYWPKIYPPLVEHLKLQVRMNIKNRAVELRTSKFTTDISALQKGSDFVKAFTLGFDVDDSIALLRLDDLYIETFEIKDVRSTLTGEHISRAIGRVAGKDGRTKHAIENATKTRVVLADQKIHILGRFTHLKMAREAIVSLILGSPPGKVYGNLRTVASRMKERF